MAIDPSLDFGPELFERKPSVLTILMSIILLIIIIVGVFYLIIFQDRIAQLNAKIYELENIIQVQQAELESSEQDALQIQEKYRKLFSENYNLKQRIKEMEPVFEYCCEELVFVDSLHNTFHEPNCFFLKRGSNIIGSYTEASARSRGYKQCYLCFSGKESPFVN